MAYSRRLGVIGILSACWLVAAVGCSDDEDRKNNSGDAGEGGDEGGGKGGTPSGGGNANNGGKAGTAGNGGSAGSSGDAGSGTAGDAGSGSGGDAGSGGIVAGAGGEGGSGTTGGGGEGGQAIGGAGGEGGEPAAPVAKSCVETCEDDTDCINGDGVQQRCNDVTKICEDPSIQACSEHADCGPGPLFWSFGCATSDDCELGYLCVDYRGETYCGVAADPDFGCDVYDTVTATLHEGGADVEVCVDPNARCSEGKCIASCVDVGCDEAEGDTCSPVSGRCECENSTECGENLVCVDNLCTQCAIDDDCSSRGLDACVAGKCGCSDLGSCPAGGYPDAPNACQ